MNSRKKLLPKVLGKVHQAGFVSSARLTREEQILEDALWDSYCYQRERAWSRLLYLANLWEREHLDKETEDG